MNMSPCIILMFPLVTSVIILERPFKIFLLRKPICMSSNLHIYESNIYVYFSEILCLYRLINIYILQ